MRQTSRAVALLLALDSANAAQTLNEPDSGALAYSANAFNPAVSAEGAPTNTLQLNSRTAGYRNANPEVLPIAGAAWKTLAPKLGIIGKYTNAQTTGVGLETTTKGSGCMNCLNKSGVWCSRTFSYLSTKATSNFFQNDNLTKDFLMNKLLTSQTLTSGSALDGGACCESVTNFTAFVQTMKTGYTAQTPPTPSNSASGVAMNNVSCPALMTTNNANTADANNAPTSKFGLSEIDNDKTAYSGWWCSNGLYKTVQTAQAITLNAQQIIPQGVNKRLELAQVGCPNSKEMCGYDTNTPLVATNLTAAKTFDMPTSGFEADYKCTWVVYATDSAPAFEMKNTANTGTRGIVTTNWQIHAMEYTVGPTASYTNYVPSKGSLVGGKTTDGYNTDKEGAAGSTVMLPLFTMPGEQFATLRTWYGEGELKADTTTGASSSWLSPGVAQLANSAELSLQLAATKGQLYGNVANIPVSSYANSTDKIALTGQNYGSADSIKFDLRQVRYFPAMVAQTNWKNGDNALNKYNSALSSYKQAKTNWDNYVAILEKNASQDAFAALFSPPKAPTVPPLPSKPWLPDAYRGYVRATAQDVFGFQENATTVTAVAQPTAQQFWTSLDAAQTVGGWGSFTAQILTFRNGWGKSFGTIGYSGDANRLKMGDVWNYKWQCAANSSATVVSTDGSQCAPEYQATAGQVATVKGATPANLVNMVTAVSLWSTANTAQQPNDILWNANGFQIVFTNSKWASAVVSLKQLDSPEPATAAKSLTGLAGAQALVASSAAALAVAAALY